MPNLLNILPRGVQTKPSLRLRTWKPSGLLDAKRTNEILHFVELEEKFGEEPFNRFIDLSAIDAVRLRMVDVEKLAARRFENYHGTPVKSAIFALNPLAFGIARMYEQLMRRTPIEVRVFSRLTGAATWLNVPIEALASKL